LDRFDLGGKEAFIAAPLDRVIGGWYGHGTSAIAVGQTGKLKDRENEAEGSEAKELFLIGICFSRKVTMPA
jgi:hypothetical protein